MEVLKMLDLSEASLELYQNCMNAVSRLLIDEIVKDEIYICGEDVALIERYIAMTILRDSLGYVINENVEIYPEEPLIEALEKAVDYPFSNIEKYMISSIIKDANIVRLNTELDVDLKEIEELELFLLDKLNLKGVTLFDDRSMLYHNLMARNHREQDNRHNVNYYDKEILYKYPLCIHLATQALKKLYKLTPSRSDVLDIAVYLGGLIEKKHLYFSVNVLLIGNQKFGILDQIRNHFLGFFPGNVLSFDIYPDYILQVQPDLYKKYDLCLTTELKVLLTSNAFFQIPVIMTGTHAKSFQKRVLDWRERYFAQQAERVKQLEQIIELDQLSDLQDIVPSASLENATIYSLNKRTLCVISTEKSVKCEIKVYHLKKPYAYHYHSVYTVLYISFDENEKHIVPYFYYLSKIMQEEM